LEYCLTNAIFTGKERDTESGLDMFGARYYGSGLGRFMTPDWAAKPIDVPYANFGNPQSLNLYSYVVNNPTTTRDPDGHAFGLDDLVGAVTGAVVGVGVELIKDVATGQKITAGGVISAGVGGAVFGEGVVNAPETGGLSVIAAGAAKGAIEGAVLNGIQQGVDLATGAQKQFSGTSMAVSVAAGAVSGGLVSKLPEVSVPGISSGQGNMKSVAQGVSTKIADGTVSSMSLKTAVKGAIGGQVANAGKTATEAATDAAGKKACGDKCQ
jgi:RHS repeat-associated protein